MSSAVTIPFTFAQLCKELSKVEVSAATQFDLYQDCSGRVPWIISITDFITIFYNLNGAFAFGCADASGALGPDWQFLNNWCGGGSCTGGAQAVGPFADVSLNVVQLVMNQWAEDINVGVDCWTICSKMQITEELLLANNLCNLRCNVCCAYCTGELAQALNAAANNISGTGTGSGIGGPRTPSVPVLSDDRLILSVLFMNSNIKVNPVELRLHFQTQLSDTWLLSRGIDGNPPPIILAGEWQGLSFGLGLFEVTAANIAVIIMRPDAACTFLYKELLIPNYFGKGRRISINGQSTECPNTVLTKATGLWSILSHTVVSGHARFTVNYLSSSGSVFTPQIFSTITII